MIFGGAGRTVALYLQAGQDYGMADQRSRPDSVSTATLLAIHRFHEAVNRHDADAVMAAMTERRTFGNTRPPPDGERFEGQAAVRAFREALFRRSPQARFETEQIIAAGDRCVVRRIFSCVRDGEPGHVRGVDLFRVRDGKAAERLSYVKGRAVRLARVEASPGISEFWMGPPASPSRAVESRRLLSPRVFRKPGFRC